MKTIYKVTLTFTVNLTANGLISPDTDKCRTEHTRFQS